MRDLLVVGQISLSTVLLIAATLLVESVIHLRSQDPGFAATDLLTMRMSLPPHRYDTGRSQDAFFEELIGRVEAQPGVRSATAAMTLPMNLRICD